MNIKELVVGKLYIGTNHILSPGEDTTCLRSTCNNLTKHYEVGNQFRCSDEGCGMITVLTGPNWEFREADEPGKHLRPLGLINDGIRYLKVEGEEQEPMDSVTTNNSPEGQLVIHNDTDQTQHISFADKDATFKMPPVKAPLLAARVQIFKDIGEERRRQTKQWGVQSYPSLIPVMRDDAITTGVRQCASYGLPTEYAAREAYEKAVENGTVTWGHIFIEEVAEAFAATNVEDMRKELIQALASGVQWLEDLDKEEPPLKMPKGDS